MGVGVVPGRVRTREGRRWDTGRGRPRLRLADTSAGGAGRGGSSSASDGDPGWYFTDFVPPPVRGQVAGVPVSLRIWPPDVIPTHPEALRVKTGVLAGFWVVVGFP